MRETHFQTSRFAAGERVRDTKLTVIGPAYENRYGQTTWHQIKVVCDCGRELVVPYTVLYNGQKYSCGCARHMRGDRDISGQPIGRLTPLEYKTGKGWLCLCNVCGDMETHRTNELEWHGSHACPRDSFFVAHNRKVFTIDVKVRGEGSIRLYNIPAESVDDALAQARERTSFEVVLAKPEDVGAVIA